MGQYRKPSHWEIYSYLKKVKADIVHVHGSSALIAVELLIAMLAGVPVRVSHSHNTICSHPLLHQVLKPILKVVSNYHLACGELAGRLIQECPETRISG